MWSILNAKFLYSFTTLKILVTIRFYWAILIQIGGMKQYVPSDEKKNVVLSLVSFFILKTVIFQWKIDFPLGNQYSYLLFGTF